MTDITIRRSERRRNYTVIDNAVFVDNRLSWQARGMLCYLLSKQDNWRVNIRHLVKVTQETSKKTGENGVYTILRELRNVGFVKMKKIGIGEHRGRVVYTISDIPEFFESNDIDPNDGNPHEGNPHEGNPNEANDDVLVSTESLVNTEYKQILNNSKPPAAVVKKSPAWKIQYRGQAEAANAVSTDKLPRQLHEPWRRWCAYRTRRAIDQPTKSDSIEWTTDAAESAVKQMAKYAKSHGVDAVEDQIESAIEGGWRGLNLNKMGKSYGNQKHYGNRQKTKSGDSVRDADYSVGVRR